VLAALNHPNIAAIYGLEGREGWSGGPPGPGLKQPQIRMVPDWVEN